MARRRLTKLTGKKATLIRDDRLVKRPTLPMIFYVKERTASGDLRHMKGVDIITRCSKEYKEMTEAETEVSQFPGL